MFSFYHFDSVNRFLLFYLGIELEELIDLLSNGHEAVFSRDGKEYIIQPECTDTSDDLVMYQSEPDVVYLCRIPIPKENSKEMPEGIRYDVGKKTVEKILSQKCISGKSFMELIQEIHVEEIF